MKPLNLLFCLLLTACGGGGSESAPKTPEKPFSIAFVSCVDEERKMPLLTKLVEMRPDLVLFMGDNVYGDRIGDDKVEGLAGLYHAYHEAEFGDKSAPFRALKSFDHLATWDDHDFGLDDGGAGFLFKSESQALFLNFWGMTNAHEGVYSAKTFGVERTIKIIMLDTRYFRTALNVVEGVYAPNLDPEATILGEAQWKWLENELKQETDVTFIVSSIQVFHDNHKAEKWANFPHELERFRSLIQGKNVFVLSGDRHYGTLYQDSLTNTYEFTSSGVNTANVNAQVTDPALIGNVVAESNFGWLTIDWDRKEMTVSLYGESGVKNELIVTLK